MLTLYEQTTEIIDLSGKSLGWNTKEVKKPNNFFRDLTNGKFNWTANTVTHQGKTYYMDKFATTVPTISEWKSISGNTIEYKYYKGLESETSANPSGNTDNIKQVAYKANGITKYLLQYTYDSSDRILTCTSLAPSTDTGDVSTDCVYYGSVDSYSSEDINSATITALRKIEDISASVRTISMYAMNDGYCLIAYPKSLGLPKTVYNDSLRLAYDSENPEDSDFNVFTLAINKVDYYVFIDKEQYLDGEKSYTIEFSSNSNEVDSEIVARDQKVTTFEYSMGPSYNVTCIDLASGNNIVIGRKQLSTLESAMIPVSKFVDSIVIKCTNSDFTFKPVISKSISSNVNSLISDLDMDYKSGMVEFSRTDLGMSENEEYALIIDVTYKNGTAITSDVTLSEIGISITYKY